MQSEQEIEMECLLYPKMILPTGYIKLKIDGRLIFEHSYIVSKFIGRELLPEEVVHHLNFLRSDNRIQNLMLFPNQKEHQRFHYKIKRGGYTQNILREIEHRWDKYFQDETEKDN